jgi:hypothetical protein
MTQKLRLQTPLLAFMGIRISGSVGMDAFLIPLVQTLRLRV